MYLFNQRVTGFWRLGALALSIFAVRAAAAHAGLTLLSVVNELWTIVAVLMIIFVLPSLWSSSLPGVVTVFDRELDAATMPDIDGDVLLLYWDELEKCAGPGQGLAQFKEKLGEGAARHDPADCVAAIDKLLSQDSLPPEPRLRQGLENLKKKLLLAKDQEARFCLMHMAVWSGAIETNLKLFTGRGGRKDEKPDTLRCHLSVSGCPLDANSYST